MKGGRLGSKGGKKGREKERKKRETQSVGQRKGRGREGGGTRAATSQECKANSEWELLQVPQYPKGQGPGPGQEESFFVLNLQRKPTLG